VPIWMAVEDEENIHDVILGIFEVWGIAGISFVDGAEAISWIDAVDAGNVVAEMPELAIIDIRLPGASGVEVSARLRKSERLCRIPIVLITAYRFTPQDEIDVMAQAQADRLIYKPLPAINDLRKILSGLTHDKENGHRRKKSRDNIGTGQG